jgi:TP901 family phage tail tape measure protein
MADMQMDINLMIHPIMDAMKQMGRFELTPGRAASLLTAGAGRGVPGGAGTDLTAIYQQMKEAQRSLFYDWPLTQGPPGQHPARGDQGAFAGLDSAVHPMRQNMGELASSIDEARQSKDKLDKNLKETEETVKSFSDKIMDMSGKLRSASRLFFYASLDLQQFANVLLNPMRAGLQVFEDYDRTMNQMRVSFELLRGTGEEDLKALDKAFLDMSKSSEFSRLEIAKAASVLGSAGIEAQTISNNISELGDLARINFTDMAAVASIALRTMRRFRLTMEETMTEMWRLTALAQQTGESIQMIATQMGYAVEIGQELGYSFAEIASSMAILTEVYGSTSIAGRRLSRVFNNLLEQGEEYGVQIRRLDGSFLSMRDQIGGLVDYLDLLADPIEQQNYLMALFGSTGASSARSMVEAFKSGRLDELLADQGESMEDTLKGISETLSDQLYVSLQDVRSELVNLNLAIGQELAPTVTRLSNLITGIIQGVASWIRDNEELLVTLGALALAATALATAIKMIGFAIEIFVALITLGKAMAVVFTLLTTGAATFTIAGQATTVTLVSMYAAALPLVIVFAKVILIIAAVVFIVKGFMDYIKRASERSEEFANSIKSLQGMFKVLIWVIQAFVALIGGVLVVGLRGVIVIFETVGAVVGAIVEVFLTFGRALERIDKLIGDIVGPIHGFVDGVGDLLGGFLPHSPSLADRIFEFGDAIRSTLVPMRQATLWGGRMTSSMGDMKYNMALGYGRATANALMDGGAGSRGANITYVDGAYIRDPEELAEIIAEKNTRRSRNRFRSTPY